MNKLNLLAIDPATLSGWACFESNEKKTTFGTWNISANKNESTGFKWIRFRKRLDIFCKAKNIGLIAFEMPVLQHSGGLQ